MINRRKAGGGTAYLLHEERGQALRLVPLIELPEGGSRWNNTSEIGGVVYGG